MTSHINAPLVFKTKFKQISSVQYQTLNLKLGQISLHHAPSRGLLRNMNKLKLPHSVSWYTETSDSSKAWLENLDFVSLFRYFENKVMRKCQYNSRLDTLTLRLPMHQMWEFRPLKRVCARLGDRRMSRKV